MKQRHSIASLAAIAAVTGLLLASCLHTASAQDLPFAQRKVVLDNGIEGRPLSFDSANPQNFEEIVARAPAAKVRLDGQLFMPATPASQKTLPAVILAPGSGGVSPAHLAHASKLSAAGLAVFVLDPFAGRGVKDTISNQGQFSMAASAYDILAAARMLAQQKEIDPQRIGAIGYSRGGIAVLMAAHRQLAQPVLGDMRLRAVMAGWPWCGYQFERPDTGSTHVRFMLGAVDNWVSVQQCQAMVAATRAANPNVTVRLFKDGSHGFGYGNPMKEYPEAIKALNAPVAYLNDKGEFLDMYSGQPRPGMTDAMWTREAAPWVGRGVVAGSKPGQFDAFVEDMVQFFGAKL